ncbi:hypothetical protein Trydic_g14703 [Trypoxylus dichotomus]
MLPRKTSLDGWKGIKKGTDSDTLNLATMDTIEGDDNTNDEIVELHKVPHNEGGQVIEKALEHIEQKPNAILADELLHRINGDYAVKNRSSLEVVLVNL